MLKLRFLSSTSLLICAISTVALAQTPTPPTTPVASPVAHPAAPIAASAPVTRDQIPALVKEAIMNNPDMIMDAIQKLREKQASDAKIQAKDAVSKHKAELFNDAASPSVGDEKTADVTMVEFFDYHCGYCRQVVPALTQLLKEDKKLRVVFKEFPILSEDSVLASRAAIAVSHIAKDKYFDFHTALMKTNGKFDEKSLLEIAKKQGINTEKLKAEMAKPEITAALDKNRELAEALGIRGTPAIIIGDDLYPGALPYEDMKKIVDSARTAKKAPAAAPAAAAPAAAPVAAPAVAPAAKPATAPGGAAIPTPTVPAAAGGR